MTVDTGKVQNRRHLNFEKIEDILSDVERLNQGKFKTLGNWSGGQILKHLTIVMNGSIDGAPVKFGLPLRLLGRILKNRTLRNPMKPGLQLPRRAAQGMVPPPVPWEEAIGPFRQVIHRLLTESKREPHAFFGPMTLEEWNQLHCRHSSLHLSFLVPEG
jgi:hypothetical protein